MITLINFNLVIALTYKSIAHTNIRKIINKLGIRFLSLPGYNFELLNSPAILVNYHKQYEVTRSISDLFTIGKKYVCIHNPEH